MAHQIQANPYCDYTQEKAKEVAKTGFNAGDGYSQVWIRDYNTFIELSAEVYEPQVIKQKNNCFF